MIEVEEELLDKITATFHHLRTGKVPQPIPLPDDLPDNEIRQVLTSLNRFLVEFAIFTESMAQVAQGELDIRPVTSKMAVAHSFKALQSNLKHLTWKTQQIAAGDWEQKVDLWEIPHRLQHHDSVAEGLPRPTRQPELATQASQSMEVNHGIDKAELL